MIKVLEKCVIFSVDENIEGISPIRTISNDIRKNIKDEIEVGKKYDVTVQKVDLEYRKIILVIDEFAAEDIESSLEMVNEDLSGPDKIEVPQDVIDKIKEEDNN